MADWLVPPKIKIKIYEALGTIGDKRILMRGNEADVTSSSGSKAYIVKYDPKTNAIIANDNGSYWQGYLGYPSIAFLMMKGILRYNSIFAESLKGIPWKEVNSKFKDYEKTKEYVKDILTKQSINLEEFDAEIEKIYSRIKEIKFKVLTPKIQPPKGD